MKYSDFIDSKSQFTSDCGFDVEDLPACMFDFQQHLVRWALRRGRRGIGVELKPSYFRQAVRNLARLGEVIEAPKVAELPLQWDAE